MHKIGAFLHSLIGFVLLLCSYGQPSILLPVSRNFRGLSVSSSSYISLDNSGVNLYLNLQLYGSDFGNWNSAETAGNVAMSLALYNSETLLSTDCLNFLNSDYIGDTLAQDLLNTSVLQFPYFQVEDYYVSSSISASNDGIYFPTTAIFASSCLTNPTNTSYGSGIYGLIGMGTQGGSSLGSFSPVFSIYLAQDSSSGELIIGTDSSYTASKYLANVFTADENWNIYGVESVQLGTYSAGNLNLSMIFDINADAIGLPLEIFQGVVAGLASEMSFNCSNETYLPYCSYVGEVNDFPDLSIQIGNQTLYISPEIYVYEGYEEMAFLGSIILNLRGLSPNLTNESYVTPAYSNYIILDSHVMSYYYSVFDASSSSGNTITLYTIDRIDYITIYILCGNAGLLLILGIFYCVTHYKKKAIREKEQAANKPDSKPKKEEKSKPKKKARRAGLRTSNLPMMQNPKQQKNNEKIDIEKDQLRTEEEEQINIIPAVELVQDNTESKGDTKVVKEFELTQIPSRTPISSLDENQIL